MSATSLDNEAGVERPHRSSSAQTAKPLMSLVTGFWAAKTLAVAHDLQLFTHLSGMNGITIEECAEQYGMALRPAEMLLTACAALGLLERCGERYANSLMSEEHLVRGKPLYFGGWIEMANRREYPV